MNSELNTALFGEGSNFLLSYFYSTLSSSNTHTNTHTVLLSKPVVPKHGWSLDSTRELLKL